jgi:hypothetical protein
VLDHPEHRIGDAVDIREEGLCDDRNAHTMMVASPAVGEVASRDTTRKVLVPTAMNGRPSVQVLCAQGRAVTCEFPAQWRR